MSIFLVFVPEIPAALQRSISAVNHSLPNVTVATVGGKSDPTDEIYPAWFDVASRSGHGCGWKGAGSPVAARVAR